MLRLYYLTISLIVRTLMELLKNETLYHNRFAHFIGSLNQSIKNVARDSSFSELYEIVALSNVLKCNIRSIYPKIDYRIDLHIMNNIFEHAQSTDASKTICILWTHTQSEVYARQSNAGNWSPNHFVPLLHPSNNFQYGDNTFQQKSANSKLVRTLFLQKNSFPCIHFCF